MSLTSNFDKLRSKKESKPLPDVKPVHNICFILPDYTQTFLSYAYLVSGSLLPDDRIVLHFTTHTVTLSGYNLEELFQHIINRQAPVIPCELERHVEILNKEKGIIVTDIKISPV